jgi:hypothetical protein
MIGTARKPDIPRRNADMTEKIINRDDILLRGAGFKLLSATGLNLYLLTIVLNISIMDNNKGKITPGITNRTTQDLNKSEVVK